MLGLNVRLWRYGCVLLYLWECLLKADHMPVLSLNCFPLIWNLSLTFCLTGILINKINIPLWIWKEESFLDSLLVVADLWGSNVYINYLFICLFIFLDDSCDIELLPCFAACNGEESEACRKIDQREHIRLCLQIWASQIILHSILLFHLGAAD